MSALKIAFLENFPFYLCIKYWENFLQCNLRERNYIDTVMTLHLVRNSFLRFSLFWENEIEFGLTSRKVIAPAEFSDMPIWLKDSCRNSYMFKELCTNCPTKPSLNIYDPIFKSLVFYSVMVNNSMSRHN